MANRRNGSGKAHQAVGDGVERRAVFDGFLGGNSRHAVGLFLQQMPLYVVIGRVDIALTRVHAACCDVPHAQPPPTRRPVAPSSIIAACPQFSKRACAV